MGTLVSDLPFSSYPTQFVPASLFQSTHTYARMGHSLSILLLGSVLISTRQTIARTTNDPTSLSFIQSFIKDESPTADAYIDILHSYIRNFRGQLSRRQLENAFRNLDQLETYYVKLQIYDKLCHRMESGYPVDERSIDLVIDNETKRQFPDAVSDFHNNWSTVHYNYLAEHCYHDPSNPTDNDSQQSGDGVDISDDEDYDEYEDDDLNYDDIDDGNDSGNINDNNDNNGNDSGNNNNNNNNNNIDETDDNSAADDDNNNDADSAS